ncbi:MAG: ABC transporter permease [Candidatus Sulfopaludibacter sp.]|nr:ABC transporter permease [Candidatus Sulfopaludibacter sp.]
MGWRRNALKTYRALLFLYPAEFRNEFREEMERLFAMRLASESRVRVWLETLADVAFTAPREHLHILAADLRHGARGLGKTPGFVFAALLAVVLGVCSATTVFSLVHAVLIRSLPYGNPERLVYVWTPAPRVPDLPRERAPFYSDIRGWQRMSRSFTSITTMQRYLAVLHDGSPQRVGAAKVPGNFFQTLEASPQLGRPIDAGDDRSEAEPVAVVSDGLWRSRFGGDMNVIGRTIHVDTQAYRVIGVMPREFSYPHGNDYPGQYQFASLRRTDVWVPAALTPKQQSDPAFDEIDAAIGRLRAGVTLEQAQAELSVIEKHLNLTHPDTWTDLEVLVVSFVDTAIGPVRPLLRLLMGAVGMIILMACGNLASLLTARSANRIHEMGVRTALGAERSRLVRLMLTESLMLSVAGGALAILLSFTVARAVVRLDPGDIPRFGEARLDSGVLLFGLFVSVATGLFSGILPAAAASRVDVGDLLRHGGRGLAGAPLRVRNALVVLQIAVAVVLLAGAGLLIRSYLRVLSEDKGFAGPTLTLSIFLDQPIQKAEPLLRDLMSRIRAIPGVKAAGSIDDLPLSTYEDKVFLEVEGQFSAQKEVVAIRETAGEYFRAMQIPLIEGRYLNDGDISADPKEKPQTVVVSKQFARRYFQSRPALGHHLRVDGGRWSSIVGVVGDVRHSSVEETPEPTIYYQNSVADAVAIRTNGTPDGIIPLIRGAVRAVSPDVTVIDIQTMNQYIDQATARRTFQTVALASFAGVAVFLALVGFYGLLSYTVVQRTAEVGVRVALGASRSAVIGMVLRYGLTLTSVGLAIGLGLSLVLTRTLASFLYGVHPVDPVTFIVVPALTSAAAVIACIVPAWRAAFVDPVSALRNQ